MRITKNDGRWMVNGVAQVLTVEEAFDLLSGDESSQTLPALPPPVIDLTEDHVRALLEMYPVAA